ncbi:MAG TPA: carbon storage regulator CsrA [Bacteroidota bacterium]|nr:carbon storage regulator CsrA [Bacteroidota bacterium]
MLILSRKKDEMINIGGTVTLKILDIQEGQIKIGIDAPREVGIYRSEIYEQILRQNREASRSDKSVVARIAAHLPKPGGEDAMRRDTN